MSEAAQALGQRLKAERERRGMSTQKTADDMHLDAWVIDALEAGDYQRIGPPVYAKGHLKKYASHLGIAAAEIAAGFAPQPEAPVANPAAQSMNIRTTRASIGEGGQAAAAADQRRWRLSRWSWAALFGGGPGSGAPPWAPGSARTSARSSLPASDVPAAAPRRSRVAAVRAAAADRRPRTANERAADGRRPPQRCRPARRPHRGAAASNAREADAAPGAGRARLRLSFSADSWVDVHDADGRRVFAGNGRANSVKTIAGMAPLRVYLGFASGVQLEVNDHAVAIGPQFFTGDVARFEAGADGVLRRAPRAVTPNGVPPHD